MEYLDALIEHSFGFLVRDFGYSRKMSAASGNAAYFKEPLLIQFWWGKGEIDILFEVTFDFARDHEVFRPYISRTFTLRELALHHDRQAMAPLRELARSSPQAAGLLESPELAGRYLELTARIMQAHCRRTLDGDLSLLEQITRERRVRA
jgi:hypothetical protein